MFAMAIKRVEVVAVAVAVAVPTLVVVAVAVAVISAAPGELVRRDSNRHA